MNIGYLYLGIAILAEVIATSALKATDGFSRLGPSLIVGLGSQSVQRTERAESAILPTLAY